MRLGASKFLLGITFAALMALPGSASTIIGTLGIVGNGQVGMTTLDFTVFPTDTAVTPPGYGSFMVGSPDTGLFSTSGVAPGGTGMIQSLNETAFPPSTPFITVGTLDLWATTAPAASGPGTNIGPFNLQDTPNGAFFDFDINGCENSSATSSCAGSSSANTFTGTFSGTFDHVSVAMLLNDIAAGASPVNTYSATLTLYSTTVPEPASMLLMGAGLLGVGLVSRRKARKS